MCAGAHERSDDRVEQRNGYRPRPLETRIGTLALRPEAAPGRLLAVSVAGRYVPQVTRERSTRRQSAGDCAVGPAETQGLWTDLLRSLVKHGPSGVRPVISDAHERLKKAVASRNRRSSGPSSRRIRPKPHITSGSSAPNSLRRAAARAQRRVADSTTLHVAGNTRHPWREWRGQASGDRQLAPRIPTVLASRTGAVSTPRLGTRPVPTRSDGTSDTSDGKSSASRAALQANQRLTEDVDDRVGVTRSVTRHR